MKLRGEELGTQDGFAKSPYIRESRRLRARTVVTEAHVTDAVLANGRRLACDLLVLATPLVAWLPPALAGAAGLPGAASSFILIAMVLAPAPLARSMIWAASP